MTISFKKAIISVGGDVESLEPSYIACESVK